LTEINGYGNYVGHSGGVTEVHQLIVQSVFSVFVWVTTV